MRRIGLGRCMRRGNVPPGPTEHSEWEGIHRADEELDALGARQPVSSDDEVLHLLGALAADVDDDAAPPKSGRPRKRRRLVSRAALTTGLTVVALSGTGMAAATVMTGGVGPLQPIHQAVQALYPAGDSSSAAASRSVLDSGGDVRAAPEHHRDATETGHENVGDPGTLPHKPAGAATSAAAGDADSPSAARVASDATPRPTDSLAGALAADSHDPEIMPGDAQASAAEPSQTGSPSPSPSPSPGGGQSDNTGDDTAGDGDDTGNGGTGDNASDEGSGGSGSSDDTSQGGSGSSGDTGDSEIAPASDSGGKVGNDEQSGDSPPSETAASDPEQTGSPSPTTHSSASPSTSSSEDACTRDSAGESSGRSHGSADPDATIRPCPTPDSQAHPDSQGGRAAHVPPGRAPIADRP